MDLKDIKAIIDLMKKNSIAEFELERQDFKIKLKRGPNGGPAPVQYEEALMAAPLSPVASVPPGTATASLPPASGGKGELEIRSPMIGTSTSRPPRNQPLMSKSAPR